MKRQHSATPPRTESAPKRVPSADGERSAALRVVSLQVRGARALRTAEGFVCGWPHAKRVRQGPDIGRRVVAAIGD